MRILHTEWSDGLGGQERRVLLECVGLSRRGHHAAIACREHSRIRHEAAVQNTETHTFPMRRPYDVASILQMAGFLRKTKFDIVNTHSGVDSWIGGIAAQLAGVPVLVRTRHLNIPLQRNLFNFIHYLPDAYITCGQNMRSTLVDTCGFPGDKVFSIPTGVEMELYSFSRNRGAAVKYGIDRSGPVITNVGILRSVKGHEVMLKGVRTVIEAFPEATFLIAGDGPRKNALEQLVKDLDIASYVIFAGFVENIPELYSFTDVAVLSSWSEGLPQSVLQAMAAGVPVVATKAGSVPEVVIHEETGLLVEPGDHEGIARSIARVLHEHELRDIMINNAKEIVKEYSSEKMIERIESLYKELLRGKRG